MDNETFFYSVNKENENIKYKKTPNYHKDATNIENPKFCENNKNSTIQIDKDMHYKMSKKIAQLTKVIYALNTRNDENDNYLQVIKINEKKARQQLIDEMTIEMDNKVTNCKKQLLLMYNEKNVNQEKTNLKKSQELKNIEYQIENGKNALKKIEIEAKELKNKNFSKCLEKLENYKNELKSNLNSNKMELLTKLQLFESNKLKEFEKGEKEIEKKMKTFSTCISNLSIKLDQNLTKCANFYSEKLKLENEKMINDKQVNMNKFIEKDNEICQLKLKNDIYLREKEKIENEYKISQNGAKNLQKRLNEINIEKNKQIIIMKQLQEKIDSNDNNVITYSNENELKLIENLKQELAHHKSQYFKLNTDYLIQISKNECEKSKIIKLEKKVKELNKLFDDQSKIQLETKNLKIELKSYIKRCVELGDNLYSLKNEVNFINSEKSEIERKLKNSKSEISVILNNEKNNHLHEINLIKNNHKKETECIENSFIKKQGEAMDKNKKLIESIEKINNFKISKNKEELIKYITKFGDNFEKKFCSVNQNLSKNFNKINLMQEMFNNFSKNNNNSSSTIRQVKSHNLELSKQVDCLKDGVQMAQVKFNDLSEKYTKEIDKLKNDNIVLENNYRDNIIFNATKIEEKWKNLLDQECKVIRKTNDKIKSQELEEMMKKKHHEMSSAKDDWRQKEDKFIHQIKILNDKVKEMDCMYNKLNQDHKLKNSQCIYEMKIKNERLENEYKCKISDIINENEENLKNMKNVQNQNNNIEKIEIEKSYERKYENIIKNLKKSHSDKVNELVILQQQTVNNLNENHCYNIEEIKNQISEENKIKISKIEKINNGIIKSRNEKISDATKKIRLLEEIIKEKVCKYEKITEHLASSKNDITSLKFENEKILEKMKNEKIQYENTNSSFRDSTEKNKIQLKNISDRLQLQHHKEMETLLKSTQKKIFEEKEKCLLIEHKLTEITKMYEHRESRTEDVEKIKFLENCNEKFKLEICKIKKDKRNCEEELVNREKNYNKLFCSNPKVGLINPIQYKGNWVKMTCTNFYSIKLIIASPFITTINIHPLHFMYIHVTGSLEIQEICKLTGFSNCLRAASTASTDDINYLEKYYDEKHFIFCLQKMLK
ncbi:hypothetical protein A3Q56_00392 [Intoshia linei]|uniref:Uncharacterized protein n=1 Tax=Intoshia linei TaxID=1819745 RepID=A0A177BE40_9BILA|nr:hypothetical protein A3Q56_00392 [Intoshia linei]